MKNIFRLFSSTLLAASLLISPASASTQTTPAAANANLAEFTTEAAAQSHCPNDTVVWLNTRTGIWHLKGERWYGNTKHGAYVCEAEAKAAGDRETRNGQ